VIVFSWQLSANCVVAAAAAAAASTACQRISEQTALLYAETRLKTPDYLLWDSDFNGNSKVENTGHQL